MGSQSRQLTNSPVRENPTTMLLCHLMYRFKNEVHPLSRRQFPPPAKHSAFPRAQSRHRWTMYLPLQKMASRYFYNLMFQIMY